ncbi:hypothetical protein QDE96_001740 [Acinetobacter baumannii]|nr:hypothetical protein [Acinetobacter baumannii]EKW1343048.1 hypothetical protein [Acinetobacter baumannii]ELA7531880.1 hypothetical protein [Acinetobacter baumannii]
MMLKFQKLIGQCLGIMLLMLIAKSSWALSCYQGTTYGGNRTQVESITQPVYVANGITAAGTTLWRSQTYTTHLPVLIQIVIPKGKMPICIGTLRKRFQPFTTRLSWVSPSTL